MEAGEAGEAGQIASTERLFPKDAANFKRLGGTLPSRSRLPQAQKDTVFAPISGLSGAEGPSGQCMS
jgi:hypothetical protein